MKMVMCRLITVVLQKMANKCVLWGKLFVQNAPFNSKLKVSFLPEVIRWLPVGRGDYSVLKLDDDYQTALVGEPRRKYLWVLSRTRILIRLSLLNI